MSTIKRLSKLSTATAKGVVNSALVAARAGLSRGRIEFKQTLTTPRDLISILITTGIFLAVMIWTRRTQVPGTHFSLGTATLVSVLALDVVYYGVVNMGDLIVVEREDGTLLRAKATPGGMAAYVTGKVTLVSVATLVGLVTLLIFGPLAFPGVAETAAWAEGLPGVATAPVGSSMSNPSAATSTRRIPRAGRL